MRLPRFRRIALILLEGVLWAPSFVFAHSGDLLLARLRTDRPPEVTLEITGDVAAHPKLRDASNPVEIMGRSLRVVLPSGRSWSVHELGKPVVTLRDGFDAPAPVPIQHPAGEPAPELTTASWTWRPSESPLRFEVPQNSPSTVLFWSTAPGTLSVAQGWGMLLAGDRSRPQPLPVQPSLIQWNWKAIASLSVAVLGLTLQAWLLLKIWRNYRAKNASNPPAPRT
jgi:hypothetical protein